jgi:hypothetical protein
MFDRNKPAGEPGGLYLVGLAAAAITMCAVLLGGALTVRSLSAATPEISIERPAAFETPADYFPAQYVNQATRIEPMAPTF